MNKNRNFEKQIEETLGSFDKMERAEPQDFFYTRLKARMESELIQQPKLRWLLKPTVVVPLLLIAVSMNVLTIQKIGKSQDTSLSEKDQFIETYNLNTSNDLELY